MKNKEKEVDNFDGFSFISNQISSNIGEENEVPIEDEVEETEEEEEKDEETEETKEETPEEEATSEEDDDEPEEKDDTKDDETDDVSEVEMVAPFVELFNKELGWDFDEEKSPKSIQELLKYMSDIIEDNSKPSYSNDTVEKFDKYVKDGGDPYEFLEDSYSGIDYDKADTKNVDTSKRLVRELLKSRGFKDKKIDRLIEKYELDDELEEEGNDALEELKEIRDKDINTKISLKAKEKEQNVKDQQTFVDSTVSKISEIKDIGGVPISKKEKELLLPYLFTKDKNGKTQLQKDYEKNPIDYLITTGYFYQNKESIKSKLKKSATTSAVADFKQKQKDIRSRKKNKKDSASPSGGSGGFEDFEKISKTITG